MVHKVKTISISKVGHYQTKSYNFLASISFKNIALHQHSGLHNWIRADSTKRTQDKTDLCCTSHTRKQQQKLLSFPHRSLCSLPYPHPPALQLHIFRLTAIIVLKWIYSFYSVVLHDRGQNHTNIYFLEMMLQQQSYSNRWVRSFFQFK